MKNKRVIKKVTVALLSLTVVCFSMALIINSRFPLIKANVAAIADGEQQGYFLVKCYAKCTTGNNPAIHCPENTNVGFESYPPGPYYICGEEMSYPTILTNHGLCLQAAEN